MRARGLCLLASLALLAWLACACQPPPTWNGSLEDLLRSQPDRFGAVMEDPSRYRVQIIYTQIDRDADNRPSFRSYTYRVDPSEYFYPASTVKLPVVALALEKLRRLGIPGLDRDTTMITGAAADFHTATASDDTSPTGLPSVGHYIRKILLVSDNDAFNRLYEFLGQRALDQALRDKGFSHTRIVHRLGVALDAARNAWTNPVRFLVGDAVLHDQPAVQSRVEVYRGESILLGVAEMVDGERVPGPTDFTGKNTCSLQDLHDIVKVLMFPESVEPRRRFDLGADDYRFLYRSMSAYPGESGIDAYGDVAKYPDGYVKFLMYGGDAPTIPTHIRIFNKVGNAYGFSTDAAYVVDFDNHIEFLLAATIYTNANEIFNDDVYEYGEIGWPFLRDLGLAIHEIERVRVRPRRPDLARFDVASARKP